MVNDLFSPIVSQFMAEVRFGRYSTGTNLNTYSALIQNFYSQETAPHQAIHITVNTGVEEDKQAGVKAFVR